MRSRMSKYFPMDAKKLVSLACALFASRCHTEDRFWKNRIEALLPKLLRNGHQSVLDAALEQLQKNHPGACSVLAELAEAQSESFTFEHEGSAWDAVLIAAPILVWTRYSIPSGALKPDLTQTLRSHLQAYVLAQNTQVAVAPCLYSIDQLPDDHVNVYRFAQQLGQSACTNAPVQIAADDLPQAASALADPRFLLAVAAAPAGMALFRWQEERGAHAGRDACLARWAEQGRAPLALALPGCEFECLLPDAYYSACRNADTRIRTAVLRTAVRYLQDALAVDAGDLRAVIGGFGERHVEEYRIGFTRRGNAEVLHGIVWPLYGEEEASFDLSYTNMEDGPERHSNVNIIDLLKETGIHEIRRHPHRFEPEYCDDCGAPLYADPLGEIVHAGMPEEVETAQPRFH
ncbi:DUF2863 family protein [Candidatus Glomeribacter gigasporarum]|nr:DUF2863 family protein [Candidatus Glomeribacter gigasporarum]